MELGDLSDLTEGEMRCFAAVGPEGVVVCRVGGALHAFTDRCSHAEASLSEGRLRRGRVTCPVHGAVFDVRDGTHEGPPATAGIAVYELDAVDETTVRVRLD